MTTVADGATATICVACLGRRTTGDLIFELILGVVTESALILMIVLGSLATLGVSLDLGSLFEEHTFKMSELRRDAFPFVAALPLLRVGAALQLMLKPMYELFESKSDDESLVAVEAVSRSEQIDLLTFTLLVV